MQPLRDLVNRADQISPRECTGHLNFLPMRCAADNHLRLHGKAKRV